MPDNDMEFLRKEVQKEWANVYDILLSLSRTTRIVFADNPKTIEATSEVLNHIRQILVTSKF
jgi:hypothetical protein